MKKLTNFGTFAVLLYFILWIAYLVCYIWNAVIFIKLLASGTAETNHLIVHAVGLFGFAPITVWF